MPQESTFKPVTDSVKQAVTDVTKQIQGLGQDITGKIRQTFDEDIEELVSWGESIFGRVKQALSPFLTSITQWFLQTEFAKKSSTYLKKLLNIEEWRKKKERMQQGIKKRSLLMDILRGLGMFFGLAMGSAGALLGAILAPILGPIIKPLEIMGKMFKSFTKGLIWVGSKLKKFWTDPFGLKAFGEDFAGGKKAGPIKRLVEWLNKFKIPKGIMKGASKGLQWIKKIFGWFIKAGKLVGKLGGTKFFSMFLKAFNKIFWPLQVVMSAIDFVTGFMETEGDIFDKFMGGVKKVIKEFFGLPISLFGKLIDWIAEQFGIENLGAEKFLTDGFNALVDFWADGYIALKDLLKGWLFDSIDYAKENFNLKEVGKSIYDMFTSLISTIAGGILALIKAIPGLESLANMSDMGRGFMETLESAAKGPEEREMTEYEKKRLAQEEQKLKMANRQTGNTTVVTTVEENGGTGKTPPMETDSSRWLSTAPGGG